MPNPYGWAKSRGARVPPFWQSGRGVQQRVIACCLECLLGGLWKECAGRSALFAGLLCHRLGASVLEAGRNMLRIGAIAWILICWLRW